MKIVPVPAASNHDDDKTVAVTRSTNAEFQFVALNVPRHKSLSMHNTLNLLACRQNLCDSNQVVFSGGLEFRTLEATGAMRLLLLEKYFPKADSSSSTRVMTLVPAQQEGNANMVLEQFVGDAAFASTNLVAPQLVSTE